MLFDGQYQIFEVESEDERIISSIETKDKKGKSLLIITTNLRVVGIQE